MDDDDTLYRYRCRSCGYEDYVSVGDGHASQTVRRRCRREFRRNDDGGRKRFVLEGIAGI